VSPKAVFTREYFSTVRAGTLLILKADKSVLELKGDSLTPGRFGTGDYYVKLAPPGKPFRILDNTDSSIILDGSKPWDVRPEPGHRIEIQVKLQKPYVDLELCIGCGICEHECPVAGQRAIRVTAENESRSPERSLLLKVR
jgi:NAD-dependent dihydropyrimidine dehydrogenase PreA subunit